MAYTERQLLQERQATVLLSTELSNMFNRAMKSVTQELEREYEQERKKAKWEREKMYSARKAFVRACLERYRASPEGTPIRTMIDSLIIANRDCSDFSERNRIQHNAIVLRLSLIHISGTSKEMRTVGTAGNQYFEWFSCQRLHRNKRKGVCRE